MRASDPLSPTLYAIFGYGCHLTPPLRRYLDGIAEALRAADTKDVELFCSGGYTMHKSAPGVSEARLIADYLKEEQRLSLPTALDEKARTTLENVRHLAHHCHQRGVSTDRLVICCDRTRRAKIAYVARRLLGDAPRFLLFDFERTPLQGLLQRTLAVGYDALALRWTALEHFGLRYIELRNARS